MNLFFLNGISMPEDVAALLRERQLWDAFQARPPASRRKYISQICAAHDPDKRALCVNRMLSELHTGTICSGMAYNGALH